MLLHFLRWEIWVREIISILSKNAAILLEVITQQQNKPILWGTKWSWPIDFSFSLFVKHFRESLTFIKSPPGVVSQLMFHESFHVLENLHWCTVMLAFWRVMWVPMVMLYALLKCFFHLLYCPVSCTIVLTLGRISYSPVSSSFNLTPLGFCGFPNWKEEEKKSVKKVNRWREKAEF